ncbi:MAG: TfoX/Sxy family protein [Eubacterium sp.]|nr:TfoX/Sxy family protein [Eubacterium sp.]
MASDKNYLNFVLEQLSDLDGVTYRAMMGEYIIYYQGKVIGGIYDNRFLLKQTKSSKKLLSDAPLELPYDGAKEMLLADIENKELMNELIPEMAEELPTQKKS